MYIYYDTYKSPIGDLYIIMKDNKLISIDIGRDAFEKSINFYKNKFKVDMIRDEKLTNNVISQLIKYFNGDLKEFNIELNITGTVFQQSVYREMLKIPYGETLSYSGLAKCINNEKAVRAIGQACKNNPIPIVIPCHRVVGKNNNIGGYMGRKTDLKYILLDIERESIK